MNVKSLNPSIDAVLENADLSQNKTLNEIVYNAFRTTLIQGKIPVGERINEKEYAERMNISRTPIRWALKMLQNERLVDYIPNIGVVVRQITIKDLHEIYAIRRSLDTLATLTAIKYMTKEDFEELDQLLVLAEKKNAECNLEAVMNCFTEFNNFIYEKSDMLRLKEVINKISEYLIRFRYMSLQSPLRREKGIIEHRLIYNAMLDKNEEAIRIAVEKHLDSAFKFLLKEMEGLKEQTSEQIEE